MRTISLRSAQLQGEPHVSMLLAKINKHLQMCEVRTNRYRRQFSKYEYLWKSDLNQIFSEFLQEALVDEEVVVTELNSNIGGGNADGDEDGAESLNKPSALESIKRKKLDLSLFDTKIKEFLNIQSEIEGLKQIHDMDFLRVNGQPIKQAMSTWVTKWMYIYTGYIQRHIAGEVSERSEASEP